MALKSYAITTVTRAAQFMDITEPGAGTRDLAALEFAINDVTDYLEDYVGFRIKKTAYTNELYDTERGRIIALKHRPVIEGETFTLQRRNSALNEDDWETVDGQYYHVDYEEGLIEAAQGVLFARTRKGYRVSYTAGYDFDNTTTFLGDTEGGGIELAAFALINAVYNQMRGSGAGIKSETLRDYKIVYGKTIFEDEGIKNLLAKYESVNIGSPLTPIQV